MTGIEYVDMYDIELTNRQAGQHWFDADTKRFFSSRTSSHAFSGPGGVFFTSSEKCYVEGSRRLYSVRQAIEGGKRIETVGEFQRFRSRSGAAAEAKRLALGA